MKTIKALSIIFLAAYLIFQGLFYIAEMKTPVTHAAIGLLGLGAGVLMFISLHHWIEEKKVRNSINRTNTKQLLPSFNPF